MPPTRGHDLKHDNGSWNSLCNLMPPTRGHDLKPHYHLRDNYKEYDAPHTGARLETWSHGPYPGNAASGMPPTRGHDLKLFIIVSSFCRNMMPPTRGHDLKPRQFPRNRALERCPPHGGTT